MKQFLRSLFSVLMGIGVCLIIAAVLGENPINVLITLVRGAFGSASAIGYTIYYSTPLIFTGLAVALAFQAGLFNIGAEGQLHMGALFLIIFGLKFPQLSPVLALTGAVLAAALGGALWAGFAGFLKAFRESHEVLVTIMLNFISYGIVSFLVFNVLKNPDASAPETHALGSNYSFASLPVIGDVSPANYSFLIALFVAAILNLVLSRTVWGFETRLVGSSPGTALRSGVSIRWRTVQVMALSGAIAGLVALNEVLGFSHKLKEGFSSGFGFVGIAVALVGGNKPWGVVLAALLFGALHKGSLDLDLDTKFITRDLAGVMQAVIILFAVLDEIWRRFFERPKGKKAVANG